MDFIQDIHEVRETGDIWSFCEIFLSSHQKRLTRRYITEGAAKQTEMCLNANFDTVGVINVHSYTYDGPL